MLCLGGPDVMTPPPPCDEGTFGAMDYEGDVDVDLRDFAIRQQLQ